MVSVSLYVEDGGSTRGQQTNLRRAFIQFIDKAGLAGNMPKIAACGSRDEAYKDFRTAHKSSTTTALLLVDSEGPVTAESPWRHLESRDGWDRPPGSTDDQYHLMVQVMESWFLADREALTDYYGNDFRPSAIPQWQDIERVPKSDVLDKLGDATRDTKKGRYDKGRHSFEILREIDPEKVTNASPHARRLVDCLKEFHSSS